MKELKKFNVKGVKVEWGPHIAVLRDTFGVGLLDLNGKYVVKGGLTKFYDIAWSRNELGAVSKRKLLIIEAGGDIEETRERVVKVEGGRSVVGTEGGFVVGTADGRILFIEGDEVVKEIKVAEELPIVRLERTKSGSILAVAGKYTLIILSPEGEVLAHQGYHWELERVRWSPDLSWMILLGDDKIEFMAYDESQGYVKVREERGPGYDARWCNGALCLATAEGVAIYEKDKLLSQPRTFYTLPARACAWAPKCRGLALCGEILAILM
ncbi:MAG: hypothetical protein GXO07_04225 [Crenarchaeota archaeon]|nr:hypothetical protein [Thermoproteota archaeon]